MSETPILKGKRLVAMRKKAYQRVFLSTGIDGQIVLEDLAQFCRLFKSTYHANPRLSDIALGRNEVVMRIQEHVQLTDDQLWKLYGNPTLTNAMEPTS